MDMMQSAITAIIQGLTEFLPVSSSGHIVLTSSLYKFFTGQTLSSGGGEEVFFDIMLHLGTLIAVVIYFREDIKELTRVFINSIKTKDFSSQEAKIPFFIIIGTFATALFYPFKDFFEFMVHKPNLVGYMLILTGSILVLTEYLSTKINFKNKELTWKKAFLIGLAQGAAVTPGISRSGSTIAMGLATGMDRIKSARFSFLLSIPVIILAALVHSLDMTSITELQSYNWQAILTGTIISAVVGYLCIKYFIMFIGKHKLNIFAYYCWAVGIFMILFFSHNF